ncbi:tryptophan dimethylallyltransferase family protein [Streptomyces specialis]|uniref:tryptophan dimethylallyltransferase family protein n=1 Tax=Streptomyces specialis TaxID=498367 RepID=UPI00073E7512|nr:tryptophan dimethylallyltransferase family protein [Streptomyces specialis]
MTSVRFRPWPLAADYIPTSYGDLINTYVEGACRHLGLSTADLVPQAKALTSVLGAWASAPLSNFEHHTSWVANNGAPLEFSIAHSASGIVGVRVLLEALREPVTPRSCQQEGHAFTLRLAEEFGVHLGRYHEIEDLFRSEDEPRGPFSLMHAAALSPKGEPPLFKLYLNPGATGAPPSSVAAEALRRLGLAEQWAAVVDHFPGGDLDAPGHEVALVGLDLSADEDARVRVYLRHTGVDAEAVERAGAVAADHREGVFARVVRAIGGEVPVARWTKAPMTCLTFRRDHAVPSSATLYCPLEPNLVNDGVAAERAALVMSMAGVDPSLYRATVAAISGPEPRRLRRLSWVAYKNPAAPVCTLYAGLNSPGGEA